MQYERPLWRAKLANTLPWKLQRLAPGVITSKWQLLAEASADAFKPLGTKAVVAIPVLTGLMHNTNAPQTAFRAMRALSHLGTNGLPPLIAAGQDPQYTLHFWVVATLGFMPTNTASATMITPLLIQWLSDTSSPQIPPIAAMALGRNHCAPQLSVPALANCVASAGASAQLRHAAVQSLIGFGDQATDALPALTNALTDPSFSVRYAATNALREIAPYALAPARPQ